MKNWKNNALLVFFLIFIILLFWVNQNPDKGLSPMELAKFTKEVNFRNALIVGGLMILLWLTELIPMYVTALIPWVAGPMLGLISMDELAKCYGDQMIFLFLGGFILAITLEKWKIHLYIANSIISFLGNKKPMVLFGFLMTTGFLSMWVSNTATALMMLPIAIAIIELLPVEESKGRFPTFILLSVAYGANIGGMGTIVGSPPNLLMAKLLKEKFHVEVDFMTWFQIGFPIAILMLLLAFLFMYLLLGKEKKQSIKGFNLEKKKLSFDQWKVISVFLFVVVFWISKDYITGKTGLFPWLKLTDASTAIFGSIVLLLLPSSSEKGKNLLSWEETKEIPWGILIMFGGGAAMAACLDNAGVIDSFGALFSGMNDVSYFTIICLVVVVAVFGTEFLSNMALVQLLVPLVGAFCVENHYPLIAVCIPVTLAASCGFMMPVGTPPNAIAYSSGIIPMRKMLGYGFIVNLIGIITIILVAQVAFGGK